MDKKKVTKSSVNRYYDKCFQCDATFALNHKEIERKISENIQNATFCREMKMETKKKIIGKNLRSQQFLLMFYIDRKIIAKIVKKQKLNLNYLKSYLKIKLFVLL